MVGLSSRLQTCFCSPWLIRLRGLPCGAILIVMVVVLAVPGVQAGPDPGGAREVEVTPSTRPADAEEPGVEEDEADAELTIRLGLRPVEGAASPLFAAARRELVYQESRPAGLKVPAHLNRDRECWMAQLGERELLVLADHSRLPRLVVDTDGDGNLNEERWCLARPAGGDGSGRAGLRYGPVVCTFPNRQVELRFERDEEGRFWVLPARYREGSIELGGRQYRVALVDCDYDGRYDRSISVEHKPLGGSPTDWMAIDRNLDGAFDVVVVGRWEVQPLTPLWVVGDLLFHATVKPDGSAVHLQQSRIGMGLLDVGTPDAELLVAGLNGVMVLKGGEGQWWLPVGPYSCWSVKLRYKEAATKYTWTLVSAGKAVGSRDFEVEEGATCARPIGSPLMVTAPGKPAAEGVKDGKIEPGATVVDRSGTRYKVAARDGRSVDTLPEVALAKAAREDEVRRQYEQYARQYQRPVIRWTFWVPYRRG